MTSSCMVFVLRSLCISFALEFCLVRSSIEPISVNSTAETAPAEEETTGPPEFYTIESVDGTVRISMGCVVSHVICLCLTQQTHTPFKQGWNQIVCHFLWSTFVLGTSYVISLILFSIVSKLSDLNPLKIFTRKVHSSSHCLRMWESFTIHDRNRLSWEDVGWTPPETDSLDATVLPEVFGHCHPQDLIFDMTPLGTPKTLNNLLPHPLNVFFIHAKSVSRTDEWATPARFLLENISKDPIYFLDRDWWSLSLSLSLSLTKSLSAAPSLSPSLKTTSNQRTLAQQ